MPRKRNLKSSKHFENRNATYFQRRPWAQWRSPIPHEVCRNTKKVCNFQVSQTLNSMYDTPALNVISLVLSKLGSLKIYDNRQKWSKFQNLSNWFVPFQSRILKQGMFNLGSICLQRIGIYWMAWKQDQQSSTNFVIRPIGKRWEQFAIRGILC